MLCYSTPLIWELVHDKRPLHALATLSAPEEIATADNLGPRSPSNFERVRRENEPPEVWRPAAETSFPHQETRPNSIGGKSTRGRSASHGGL